MGRVIRVVVVGGHPVIRGVVRLACQGAPDLELAGEIDRSNIAVDEVWATEPDIAVVDLDIPEGEGVRILSELRTQGFTGRILVLTDRVDGGIVLAALRRGADGIVAKAEGLRTIAAVMRRLVAGEQILAPELEGAAAREIRRFATTARESSRIATTLTAREREVLEQLAEGLSTRQMGRRLGISARTVETHLAKLYRKLDVHTRVQAVSRAVTLGLIELR